MQSKLVQAIQDDAQQFPHLNEAPNGFILIYMIEKYRSLAEKELQLTDENIPAREVCNVVMQDAKRIPDEPLKEYNRVDFDLMIESYRQAPQNYIEDKSNPYI